MARWREAGGRFEFSTAIRRGRIEASVLCDAAFSSAHVLHGDIRRGRIEA